MGLGTYDSVIKAGGESDDGRGRATGSARIVLDHPKICSFGKGRESRGAGINLGVRPPVKVDNGKPTLPGGKEWSLMGTFEGRLDTGQNIQRVH